VSLLALALAAVFAWAAVAKLLHRPTTSRSFAAFGLPVPDTLAVAVPVSEIVLAAVLVVNPALGATLALAVLAAFTTQLLLARRRGADTGCGCFGGSRPATPNVELARNAVLALAAVAVLVTA
jgi:uncharacterized membrane protein YphA (DoxX/SURF4 family)